MTKKSVAKQDIDFGAAVGSATKLPETVRRGRMPTERIAVDRVTGLAELANPSGLEITRDELISDPKPLTTSRAPHVVPEHKLDLHGESVAECVHLLKQCFDRARLCSYVTLLVVHGKGLHSGGVAVVRNATLNWLRAHAAHYGIKRMYHPKRSLGGSGATIVVFR